MLEHSPAISVLMSVYNGDKYLRNSIDSILSQTFTNFEFIIIDDGSTDNTSQILSSYDDVRIHIVRQTNQGLTKSLNKAIKLAKGKYLARQDSDDISMPTRLQVQFDLFEQNKNLVLVGSSCTAIDATGKETKYFEMLEHDLSIRWMLLFANSFCHSSVMLQASILRENSIIYDESIEKAQDYSLWSKLLDYGEVYNIQEPLVKYREHNEQISVVNYNEQKKYAIQTSLKNLSRLGITVSTNDLRVMHELEINGFLSFADTTYRYAVLYGILLRSFLRENISADPKLFRRLKVQKLDKITSVINSNDLYKVFQSGLFKIIVSIDVWYLIGHFIKRIYRKLVSK